VDLDRRRFLTALGVAGAVTSASRVGAALSRGRGGHPARRAAPPTAAVRALFGDVTPGARLADRWRVVAIFGVTDGAIPVILAGADGARFQVDVLARDDAGPSPVAVTRSLGLFLSNGGDGALASRENHGLGARALAAALARNEAAGARVPPSLLTLRARLARVPLGAFRVVG
jgi:hypothetical protein